MFFVSFFYFKCVFFCFLFPRVLLDRAHSDYNSAFRQLDVDMLSSPEHTSINLFANTSETNTSDKCFSKDLSQILVNIKSCRWRHFRPRTTSLHDSDIVDFSCRTFHKGITRTGTAQPGTQTCSTSASSKSSSGSAHFGMWFDALIFLFFTWECLFWDVIVYVVGIRIVILDHFARAVESESLPILQASE